MGKCSFDREVFKLAANIRKLTKQTLSIGDNKNTDDFNEIKSKQFMNTFHSVITIPMDVWLLS